MLHTSRRPILAWYFMHWSYESNTRYFSAAYNIQAGQQTAFRLVWLSLFPVLQIHAHSWEMHIRNLYCVGHPNSSVSTHCRVYLWKHSSDYSNKTMLIHRLRVMWCSVASSCASCQHCDHQPFCRDSGRCKALLIVSESIATYCGYRDSVGLDPLFNSEPAK